MSEYTATFLTFRRHRTASRIVHGVKSCCFPLYTIRPFILFSLASFSLAYQRSVLFSDYTSTSLQSFLTVSDRKCIMTSITGVINYNMLRFRWFSLISFSFRLEIIFLIHIYVIGLQVILVLIEEVIVLAILTILFMADCERWLILKLTKLFFKLFTGESAIPPGSSQACPGI